LYKKAISIEHDNPKLFFDMAECYARTDRLIIAVHVMDTAIILDSLYAPFYNNRGLFNYKLYNDQNAINDYKKAIELDAKNEVFHINLAAVYYSNNNFSEACAEFKLAVRLGTNLNDLKGQPEVEKLKDLCK
jgi:tetratricopeptide (TPR) repeat protein